VDADEAIVSGEIFFSSLSHGFIGLDAIDAVAVFEEQLAQEASSRTDVCDDVAGLQPAFAAEQRQHFGRITWAIANVIRDTVGEALFGVCERHMFLPERELRPSSRRGETEETETSSSGRDRRSIKPRSLHCGPLATRPSGRDDTFVVAVMGI